MAHQLDPLLPPEDLYDYRCISGSECPPRWIPHNQGDVFRDVALPGIKESSKAMLFQHPCTMRAGAGLKPQVLMVEVSLMTRKLKTDSNFWSTRTGVMPLPALDESRATYTGNFLAIATVPSEALDRRKRIATLSLAGRLQYQQRVIFYLTRFLPSIEELREATASVEAEIALQEAWTERAVETQSNGSVEIVIDEAEKAFEAFMGEADRRNRLKSIADQYIVNREVLAHLNELFPPTSAAPESSPE